MISSTRRLSDCRPGSGGEILDVDATGPLAQRLQELGLVRGTEVTVVRVAPLGDPIEIRVDASRLAIRKSEARQVLLVP